jgi:hypothetical protein
MPCFIETPSAGGTFRLNAANITAAKLHTATGLCVVTFTDGSAASKTVNVPGQDGTDLYNALVAIAAGTYTTGA